MKVYCDHPWKHLKIRADGAVKSCCFQGDATLGNLLTEGFEAIWDGTSAKSMRDSILDQKLDKHCDVPRAFCPYRTQDLSNPDVPQDLEDEYLVDTNYDDAHTAYPKRLELDLHPSFCNIGGLTPNDDNPTCIMCGRDASIAQQLPDRIQEVCEALIPLLRRVGWIHIMGLAEPFWKGKIHQVLDWLGYGDTVPIVVSTNTNGTILTEKSISKYLERTPRSETRFSLDSASPETFRKIRQIDGFDTAVKNLRIWNKKRVMGKQKLWIANNINTYNVGEIEQMVELAADTGVDGLSLWPTDPISREGGKGVFGDAWCINESNTHLFTEAQEKAIKRGHELKVNIHFIKPLDLNGVFYNKPLDQGVKVEQYD